MSTNAWCTALGVLLTGLTFPLATAGQTALAPGDRVRFDQPDGGTVTGVVAAVSAREVTISGPAGEATYPVEGIAGLERSMGRHRSFGRTFGITLGVTSLVGGTASALTWTPCRETGFLACFLAPESRADAFAWGLAGGAIIGLPVGVILGLAVTTERWEPGSLPSIGPVAFSVRAAPGRGVGLVGALPLGSRRP